MKKFEAILLVLAIILKSNNAVSQEESNNKKQIEPIFSYTADAARNFSGGIKKGNAYIGLIDAGVILHTDKYWKNGEFTIELQNGHGENLSENYIGDAQLVSNIENGNYTYLYQAYYRQSFENGYIFSGIHDLNSEFCTSEYGASLTNSSFGMFSTFSLNFPVSMYPKTSLALAGCYKQNENIRHRLGFYDGDAGSLDDEKYNLSWSISANQGLLTIYELECNIPSINQVLKIGSYYHSGKFYNTSRTDSVIKGNYGFYGIIDQTIYKNNEKTLGAFMQISYAPDKININDWYAGFGVSYSGICPKCIQDALSLGIALARIDKKIETDLELNYHIYVCKHLSLQPTIHYVINPGVIARLDNAFAAYLRLNVVL
ncbi:MAG TPA: carbohydrate porin [Bacteroidales bacterium]|nr:carbohydrate porin [Bacteroidales bacterium]